MGRRSLCWLGFVLVVGACPVAAAKSSIVLEADKRIARIGEVIQVNLTIIAPHDLYYLVVEDMLPAGAEAIDTSLDTTSLLDQDPALRRQTGRSEDVYAYDFYWWWWNWYSRTEMRDEKTVLFATYLPRGTYEYTYLIRASLPGQYGVIPAHAYEMYFPEVFGRSDGGAFAITE